MGGNSDAGLDENGHYTLVLVRHGESQWNKENRFTGWVDVPLAEVCAVNHNGEKEGSIDR